MDHASEHGRSDRATAEAGGHDADFGLRVFIVPLFGLVDEFEVHLFHPWAIAIAQSVVGNAGQGIVLGAYAGNVVAPDAIESSEVSCFQLIAQDPDIGDVFWILVLVVACAIEASHKQTCVRVLLTDQQRCLELRQCMAAVCICRQVLRRCWIRFHVIRPCLCIGMFVAHCMLPGEDAISRFWCRRGSNRCVSCYICYLALAKQ